MKSILITGVIVDVKSKIVYKYEGNYHNIYVVKSFTGIDFKTLEHVDVSIDSVRDIAINPPTRQDTNYYVELNDGNIPMDLLCTDMTSSDRVYARYCDAFNDRGEKLCKSPECIAMTLGKDVFAYLEPDTKVIDFDTGESKRFIRPMFIDTWHKTFVSLVKSAFLTEVSNGLYEYADTFIVTNDNIASDIILPKNAKNLVIDVSNSMHSIVFNKAIDKIDSIGRESITKIAISKETTHKQLAIITKFVMGCKGIKDSDFDVYLKYENYATCCKLLREDTTLSNEIYGDIEVVVY
jgi:hypothetical protein